MIEKIIDFIFEYIYIIVWSIILLFYLQGLFHKKMYRYVQMTEKEAMQKMDEEDRMLLEKMGEINKFTKIDKIALIWYIFIIILFIISTVTVYLNVTKINNLFFSPITFFLLYLIVSAVYLHVRKKTRWIRVLKSLLIIIGYCLLFPIYYKYFKDKTFFFDSIVIFITLFVTYIFCKSKFKYITLLILLGANIIIFGQKFNNDECKLIYDLMFAIGTGLITTAISNIFIYYETRKKNKMERDYEICVIRKNIFTFINIIFFKLRQKLNCDEKSFHYVDYPLFIKKLFCHLKDANANILPILEYNLIGCVNSLIFCCERLKQRSNYLILNNIFYNGELIEFSKLGEILKQIGKNIEEKDNSGLKYNIINFFNSLDKLSKVVPEIEDFVNGIGKKKVYVEYEIGTSKMVWPDGTKVKDEDLFKSEIDDYLRKER